MPMQGPSVATFGMPAPEPAVVDARFGVMPVPEAQATKVFYTGATTAPPVGSQAFITASSTATATPTFTTVSPAMISPVVEPMRQAFVPAADPMGRTLAPTAINMQAQAAGLMPPASPEQADSATMVVPDGQGGCWFWVPDDEEEPAPAANAGMPPAEAYPGMMAVDPMQQAGGPPTAILQPEMAHAAGYPTSMTVEAMQGVAAQYPVEAAQHLPAQFASAYPLSYVGHIH